MDVFIYIFLFYTLIALANIISKHSKSESLKDNKNCTEVLDIPKTSVEYFTINSCTNTFGCYLILVGDVNNKNGAYAAFMAAGSSDNDNPNSITRIVSNKGNDNQCIDATWVNGEKIKIRHSPAAGSGTGNFSYRVRVFSAL